MKTLAYAVALLIIAASLSTKSQVTFGQSLLPLPQAPNNETVKQTRRVVILNGKGIVIQVIEHEELGTDSARYTIPVVAGKFAAAAYTSLADFTFFGKGEAILLKNTSNPWELCSRINLFEVHQTLKTSLFSCGIRQTANSYVASQEVDGWSGCVIINLAATTRLASTFTTSTFYRNNKFHTGSVGEDVLYGCVGDQ